MTLPSILTRLMPIAAAATLLAGCGASLDSLTTGGLGPKPAPVAQNDPVTRAMQVGTTSARAVKCGFNFDPAKLKANFLAAETAAAPADAGKVAQVYDVAFNGISKAVSGQGEEYCSGAKTTKIKEALNRHLAGDFTPAAPEPVQEDTGLFSGFSSDTSKGYKASNPWERNE